MGSNPNNDNVEREVKFLEIDKAAVIKKLNQLGALNLGETLLSEVIFYPKDDDRPEGDVWVRIRTKGEKVYVAHKSIATRRGMEVDEIEFEANDAGQVEKFLQAVGLRLSRRQEKLRHSFTLDDAQIDIDTWPGNVPVYLEIEGPNEASIKATAEKLGFKWEDAEMLTAGFVLKERYGINVWELEKFTFEEIK